MTQFAVDRTQMIRTLTRAVEQSASTVVITDCRGNIEYVNPRFTRLTGYSFSEVEGKSPRILQSGNTPREVYTEMWGKITNGEEWRGEIQNRRKDGSLYWESITISPIKNDQGEITHYLGVEEDVTERKELEQRLAHTLAELETSNAALTELNTMKDKFIGMAAHDLRNPISRIRLAAQLQLETQTSPEESRELLLNMVRAADTMVGLINDVLDVTQINSGNVELKPREVDTRVFLTELAAENTSLAAQKDIRIRCEFGDTPPTIQFDPKRIRQVVENLLSNAIKFSHRGTKIVVSATTVADTVEISVSDEGQGIRSEDLPKLFGEFQKARTRPTANEPSTGLGLAISKRIIQLHGGEIGVESTFGKGSRFYFRLPLQRSADRATKGTNCP